MTQQQQFEAPEEVDRYYAPLIDAEADLGRKADLRVKAAEEKIRIKERTGQDRVVAAWKRLAMIEFPKAAMFPEMVTGNTEEEIRLSAESVHRRLEEMSQSGAPQDTFAQARQAYGPGPAGGGSGMTPTGYTPPNMAEERWNLQFAERFNNAERDAYGQRIGISQADINRYTNNRFITHVKDRLQFWADMTRSDAGYRTRRG